MYAVFSAHYMGLSRIVQKVRLESLEANLYVSQLNFCLSAPCIGTLTYLLSVQHTLHFSSASLTKLLSSSNLVLDILGRF